MSEGGDDNKVVVTVVKGGGENDNGGSDNERGFKDSLALLELLDFLYFFDALRTSEPISLIWS